MELHQGTNACTQHVFIQNIYILINLQGTVVFIGVEAGNYNLADHHFLY